MSMLVVQIRWRQCDRRVPVGTLIPGRLRAVLAAVIPVTARVVSVRGGMG
jgi:hypothetical protein